MYKTKNILDGVLPEQYGCYEYIEGFGSHKIHYSDLSIAKCLDYCKTHGKRLALIDGGHLCVCSDSLPDSGRGYD